MSEETSNERSIHIFTLNQLLYFCRRIFTSSLVRQGGNYFSSCSKEPEFVKEADGRATFKLPLVLYICTLYAKEIFWKRPFREKFEISFFTLIFLSSFLSLVWYSQVWASANSNHCFLRGFLPTFHHFSISNGSLSGICENVPEHVAHPPYGGKTLPSHFIWIPSFIDEIEERRKEDIFHFTLLI